MTMKRPFGPRIDSSSAWADTFRLSLGPTSGHFMSRITFLSCTLLRVAVNTAVDPNRVVTVFFDRTMKGKL